MLHSSSYLTEQMLQVTSVPQLEELDPNLETNWQASKEELLALNDAPLLQKLDKISHFYNLGVMKFGPGRAMVECAKALAITNGYSFRILVQLSRGFEEVKALVQEGVISDDAALTIVRVVNQYGESVFGANKEIFAELRALRAKSDSPIDAIKTEAQVNKRIRDNVDRSELPTIIKDLRTQIFHLLTTLNVIRAASDLDIVNTLLKKIDRSEIAEISTKIELLTRNLIDVKNNLPEPNRAVKSDPEREWKTTNHQVKLAIIGGQVERLLKDTEAILNHGTVRFALVSRSSVKFVDKEKMRLQQLIPLLTELHGLFLIAAGLIDRAANAKRLHKGTGRRKGPGEK